MDLRTALRAQVSEGLTLATALHDMITLSARDEGPLLERALSSKLSGPTS